MHNTSLYGAVINAKSRNRPRPVINLRVLSESGVSLVGVLVGVAILGITAVASSNLNVFNMRANRRFELRGELETTRRLIYENLDCTTTFSKAGIDPTNPNGKCPSTSTSSATQKGPWITLYRHTADGSTRAFSVPDPSTGIATLGNWSMRVSCSETEQSLVIRVARPVGNDFAKDPLTGKLMDWDNPGALIAGGVPPVMPLCFNALSPISKLFKGQIDLLPADFKNIGDPVQTQTRTIDVSPYTPVDGFCASTAWGWYPASSLSFGKNCWCLAKPGSIVLNAHSVTFTLFANKWPDSATADGCSFNYLIFAR